MTDISRQPAGQPTGGQFAPTTGSDAGLELGYGASEQEEKAAALARRFNDAADQNEEAERALLEARWGEAITLATEQYPEAKYMVLEEYEDKDGIERMRLAALTGVDADGEPVVVAERAALADYLPQDVAGDAYEMAAPGDPAPIFASTMSMNQRFGIALPDLPDLSDDGDDHGRRMVASMEDLHKHETAQHQRWVAENPRGSRIQNAEQTYEMANHRAQLLGASGLIETIKTQYPGAARVVLGDFEHSERSLSTHERPGPTSMSVYDADGKEITDDLHTTQYADLDDMRRTFTTNIASPREWVRSGVASSETAEDGSPAIVLDEGHLRMMRGDLNTDPNQGSLMGDDLPEHYGWKRPAGFRG